MHPFTGVYREPAFPLLSLPIELVENVYKSLDSFDTAVKLATTSMFMHTIFKRQKAAIYLSILPCDPVFNGASRFASFAEQAIAIYEAEQKDLRVAERKKVAAVLVAAPSQDGGAQSEDAAAAEDVGGEGGAATPPNAKKTVPAATEPEGKDEVNALASNGLTGVQAVVRIASIVNQCSAIVFTKLAPTRALGFDSTEIMLYRQYGEEIVRGVLYDLWQYIVTRQKLKTKYYKGHKLPSCHPTNDVLSTDFVIYLGTVDLERLGFPANRMLYSILHGHFHRNSYSYETEPRILLLSACRDRSELIHDFENMLDQQRLTYAHKESRKVEESKKGASQEHKQEEPQENNGNKEPFIKGMLVKLDKLEERCAAHEAEKIGIQDEIKSLRESLESVIPGLTRLQ